MASMEALRGLILICLLQMSVQDDVNTFALAKMIKYFDDNVQPKPGAQYAIAIRLTKKQCTDENFSVMSVFSIADAKIVKETISNGIQTCNLCTKPNNVIAATPQYTRPKHHSEYRLLYPVNNSPMDRLLENVNNNSCVVFYTYNSPCVNKCMSGEKNILDGLLNWKNKLNWGINVFVFQSIWEKDVTKDLPEEFQKIDEKVSLYQCLKSEQMNCLKCRVQQATSYCRTVPNKTYY